MKIYNEVIIDMNTGETIYEDSFDYKGDIALCCAPLPGGPGGGNQVGITTAPVQNMMGNLPNLDISGIDMEAVTEAVTTIKENNLQTITNNQQTQAMTAQTQASDVQLNAMPSLPSISNVGAAPFTGVVNWNAIPGGFQPLPQTAGASKKLYQLSQFHGGINKSSSPRDIADFECQEAENITVSEVGRIKLLGDITNTDNSITVSEDDAFTGSDMGAAGYGLFQFTAPADHDAANAGKYVLTLTADGNDVNVHDASEGTPAQGTWMTIGSVDNHGVAQIYYAAGNGLYAADAYFGNTNANRAKIYVYRKDYNSSGSAGDLITATWKEGNPLIDSPTFEAATGGGAAATDGRVALEFDDGSVSFAVTTVAGASTVHVGSSGTGTWNGDYFFYISWIFDGGVETGLTALQASGGSTFANEKLTFNFSVEDNNSSRNYIGGDPRIEGARIYFKESGTAERWLLAEVSLVNGVKGALDSTFIPWHEPATDTFDLETNMLFENPPEVYSYASLNGYYANEVYSASSDTLADEATGPTSIPLRYKTVVVGQAGVIFIGNVKFDGKDMPDSMMFSMPGKPAVFPKFNIFDSPSSDGSPITALAAFRDKILQFKENGMYVINVSNPAQFYAEASFRDCGVFNPCQVFTTSFGIIFANKHGCFIYDGQKVISLTGGKFDVVNWGITEAISADYDTASVPSVGYDPRSQSIIVLKNIGNDATSDDEDAWIYNMVTQSWTEGIGIVNNNNNERLSNFIITSGGYLTLKQEDVETLFNYNHDKATDTDAQTITYITKDLDFGLPTQTKKIFKIYVTYKGDGSSVTVTYGANGDTTPTEALTNSENSGATLTSAGVTDHNVATFTLNSHPSALKSIALKFTGSAAADFEINDISILYRVRPIK